MGQVAWMMLPSEIYTSTVSLPRESFKTPDFFPPVARRRMSLRLICARFPCILITHNETIDRSLPIFHRSARVRATGRLLNVVNHIVVTIERGLAGLDNTKTIADSNHLLQGGFDLARQQVDCLRRNALKLGLELIIESGNSIDLP